MLINEPAPHNYRNGQKLVLFSGSLNANIRNLCLLQNAAVRILTKTRKCDHVMPALSFQHKLPIHARCDFNVLLSTHLLNLTARHRLYCCKTLSTSLSQHSKEYCRQQSLQQVLQKSYTRWSMLCCHQQHQPKFGMSQLDSTYRH